MINKIKAHFNVSRRELRGMVVVFLLFILIYSLPYIYERFIYSPLEFSITEIKPHMDSIISFKSPVNDNEDINLREIKLFRFNPNGLSIDDWIKLGLTSKQAASIKKYEAKGGKFYKNEDLKKMFVISAKQYVILEPYIDIPSRSTKNFTEIKSKKVLMEDIQIDINSADSINVQLIKGIGPVFASRIIRYRDRLGGFVQKEQLKEIYGIDSLKFHEISKQINIDTQNVKFVDINRIDIKEFNGFPYLNYRQKKALLAYRKQHGPYQNLEGLKKAALLDDNILRKISPYFKFR
ncbi:helix-hairpin-helix domain-containing protein [Pseudopedobacter sp.]|uniref:helix-hairpin-helix domain-containing protein n=1 Tax=Pseudopedobacter sp. TaxID=1936787 RepID=UPI003341A551